MLMRFALLTCTLMMIAPPSANPQALPVPKGTRILGMDVWPAEDGDFDAAWQNASTAGVQAFPLSVDWNATELPGPVRADDYLVLLNDYYAGKNLLVALAIRPIHTNQRVVPGDLAGKRLDDPLVIARFKAFVDFVFSKIPNLKLEVLYIGSEFDEYLGSNQSSWLQYEKFYRAVKTHVKTRKPTLKVGVESSFNGLTILNRQQLVRLNQFTDVIGVSHYPINADGSVQAPVTIQAAFDALVALYPTKPIYFNQLGYPSSTVLKSSWEKQRQFVSEVFKAWDRHSTRVRYVSLSWQTDLDAAGVAQYADFYGYQNVLFREFLATLGMRTYFGAGADKPAFIQLRQDAKARGW